MSKHWLVELVGHASGLSEAQLRQIEKALPRTKALIDLLNKAQPIIEQAQSLYVSRAANRSSRERVADCRPRCANFD
jgi:hypothetical protein